MHGGHERVLAQQRSHVSAAIHNLYEARINQGLEGSPAVRGSTR